MTAEERLAYFQGEKKRSVIYQTEKEMKGTGGGVFKLKFLLAVILFILFLSLDYTEYEICGIGSERIIHEVITDFDISCIPWKVSGL